MLTPIAGGNHSDNGWSREGGGEWKRRWERVEGRWGVEEGRWGRVEEGRGGKMGEGGGEWRREGGGEWKREGVEARDRGLGTLRVVTPN